MFLTVFTPAYNRAYIIRHLYDSLCRQTLQDFEWVVVDDGSTDDTAELIRDLMAENRINIRYIYQPNGGKHRAINRGVQEARGQLFFIVDSDDYLTEDAVSWIYEKSKEIISDNAFAGISGLRIKPDGSKIGGENKFTQIDANAIEIRTRFGITGDLAEVYKTEILRKYPFPDIPDERFCSEGLVWNRIAMSGYKLRYCYKGMYVCEYLGDGLTVNRINCRRKSPEYSMLLYSELLRNPYNSHLQRFKYSILFWRYSELSRKSFLEKLKMIGWTYGMSSIFGLIMRKLNR